MIKPTPREWTMAIAGAVMGVFISFFISSYTRFDTIRGLSATGTVQGVGQSPPAHLAQDVDFRAFWDLWQMLQSKYYEQPVGDKTLFYGALEGMTANVGDPYTTFFEPVAAQQFEQSLAGNFDGIGAELGLKDEQIRIVAPLPDTPAERAGLRAGDLILAVDSKDTAGMSIEQAVTLIRGKKGTPVHLTILRPQTKKAAFDVTVIRERIQVKSVKLTMLDGPLAHITVTSFNQDTKELFRDTVGKALAQRPRGVILDLRNNPGGYLDASLTMAAEWLGDREVVLERRQGVIVHRLHGIGRARLKDVPTVVLVNQGSASASEIVAGALQDEGQATLIGEKTFGKGSVQDYVEFDDGSGVKITVAEWLTPQGRAIHEIGLEPDILIERTAEDYEAQRDPQLERAREVLTGPKPGATEEAASASSSARPARTLP